MQILSFGLFGAIIAQGMQLKIKQQIDNLIGGGLVALHLLPVRVLGKLLRLNHSLAKPPKNIIVIKMLGLGSLILAGDALLALKKKYPEAKFTLIGGRALKDSAHLLNLFDRIMIIDDSAFLKMLGSAFMVIQHCIRLRGKWCFDFEVYSRLTTIFSLYTFSRNRFGFEFEKVNFRNYLNTHNTYFNQFIPTEENYNKMAENAGAVIDERYYLPQKTDLKNANTIVINNTCSDLSIQRKLEPKQVAELIAYIYNHTTFSIALVGAPSDEKANKKIIELSGIADSDRIENWAGHYKFEAYLKKLAKEATAIITIDSAPLHMAARLQIPIVAVWGPTQPQSLAPNWLRKSRLYREVNLKVLCSPCVHQTKELPCRGNNFCMKDLRVSTIYDSLSILLHDQQTA